MKLFRETGKNNSCKRIELELDPKTVDYILDESKQGDTISNIRDLIMNLFNCQAFTRVDLFSLMRSTDDDHRELAINIIESCSMKYGDSCFLMIDDLAHKVIEKFDYRKEDFKP